MARIIKNLDSSLHQFFPETKPEEKSVKPYNIKDLMTLFTRANTAGDKTAASFIYYEGIAYAV